MKELGGDSFDWEGTCPHTLKKVAIFPFRYFFGHILPDIFETDKNGQNYICAKV